MHMKRTADRLFGNEYIWSILGAGKNQMTLASMGAAQGANVRVGLEDSLWIEPGRLARSSKEQVIKVRNILEEFSLNIATPNEVRTMLNLKGIENVAF